MKITDKDRLDFIEKNFDTFDICAPHMTFPSRRWSIHYFAQLNKLKRFTKPNTVFGETLREAIDNAIKAMEGKE